MNLSYLYLLPSTIWYSLLSREIKHLFIYFWFYAIYDFFIVYSCTYQWTLEVVAVDMVEAGANFHQHHYEMHLSVEIDQLLPVLTFSTSLCPSIHAYIRIYVSIYIMYILLKFIHCYCSTSFIILGMITEN